MKLGAVGGKVGEDMRGCFLDGMVLACHNAHVMSAANRYALALFQLAEQAGQLLVLAAPVAGVLLSWTRLDAQALAVLGHQAQTVMAGYVGQSLLLAAGVAVGTAVFRIAASASAPPAAMGGVGAAGLLLLLGAVSLVARRVAAPLKELSTAAAELEAGRHDSATLIPLLRRGDEVGDRERRADVALVGALRLFEDDAPEALRGDCR
jgi:HAMP domain-containing protein